MPAFPRLPGAAQDRPNFDLTSIPLADWLKAGEHVDIPWELKVHDGFLRMDQSLEVPYYAHVDEKALSKSGSNPNLYLITHVGTDDGEWLDAPNVTRYSIHSEPGPLTPRLAYPMPGMTHMGGVRNELQYSVHFLARPGSYVLWVVLVDRVSKKHNVAKRRIKVEALNKDPFPDLYLNMPKIQFGEAADGEAASDFNSNDLYLPVHNKHPIQIELISMFSEPDQWKGRPGEGTAHIDDSVGALRALSQLKMESGSLSLVGLDLVRRRVAFEQRDFDSPDWPALREAIRSAQSPAVSVDALEGAKKNGAFFRDFMTKRLSAPTASNEPMRVMIIVGSSQLFADGSDVHPLQLEGDCHCRVYYLRFRLNALDFDQVEGMIKPLHPQTFGLMTAFEMRQALARIVHDLEGL